MLSRIATTLAAVALCASPALAQKKPAISGVPFWTGPKMPHAQDFVPGLTAALGLTPEQIEKIAAARTATIDSPEIRALKSKKDPNATAEELAKAAEKRAEATEKLHKEVEGILTKSQTELIEKVNDAYAKVVAAVGEEYQQKLIDAKGNKEDTAALRKEMRETIAANFEKKLGGVLSAEQMKAVEEAKKQAANKPGKPKK